MDQTVTLLLQKWRNGDEKALSDLMPLVYEQLRVLAGRYMRSERGDHTLRPTALVHEAYLRMAQADGNFSDRAHFLAVSATVMRHILVDWAKSQRRVKRGSAPVRVELEEGSAITWDDHENLIEVDRLLNHLASFDQRKATITEMIFFSGTTYEETADFLGISAVTVHRELKMAKAWMLSELQRKSQPLAKVPQS